MTLDEKKQIARTYLEHYSELREYQRNSESLLRYFQECNKEDSFSDVISEAQKKKDTFLAKHKEVVSTLSALPDTKGKTALFAHYILEEPYKCLAIDLDISDRHLNRLVDTTLIQLADIISLNVEKEAC